MLGWIFVAFAAGRVLERARPGWQLAGVCTWSWRVVAVNATQLAVVGAWRNRPGWNGRCGFDAAQEDRLPGMLRLRDVHPQRRPR